MGLFSKKDNCCICGGSNAKEKLKDGWICLDCMAKTGGFLEKGEKIKNVSKQRIMDRIKENRPNIELSINFKPTKKIENYIWIDEDKKEWLIPSNDVYPIVMKYEDIISVDVIQNDESITKGGLGAAIVGGALFGQTGAIAGSLVGGKITKEILNCLAIKITTRNKKNPIVYIFLLKENEGKVKANTTRYNYLQLKLEQILSVLDIMCDEIKNNSSSNDISNADEIIKYKKLLDDSIITQEEFEAKKKQLLGV